MSIAHQWFVVLAFAGLLAIVSEPALSQASEPGTASSPSLCVSVEPGCHVPGSIVRAKIILGSTDADVVGAQFSIDYDPAILDFVDITPGATCDSSSPFEIETAKTVDEGSGTVFYAVGVDPFGGGMGTMGQVTAACIEFVMLDRLPSSVCLFNGVNPHLTRVVDINGNELGVDNSLDCPPTQPPPIISCHTVEAADSCDCSGTPADCSSWTDDCNEGICDEDLARCIAEPANEGQSCDDHDDCTTNETCHDGDCFGTDCQNPSLCVVTDESCEQDNSPRRRVTVQLGESDREIVGAQFSIQYDPNVLELVSISPGSTCDAASPFSVEVTEITDKFAGEAFYAVIVDPFSGAPHLGTNGPATLACLEFDLLDMFGNRNICLFADENPLLTLLAGYESAIPIYNLDDCPTDEPSPALSCAEVCVPVPTLSEWGIVILTILLVTMEKLYFCVLRKRRSAS